MRKSMAVFISAICALAFAAFAADVVVAPRPYTKAFKNPLKGFRGGQEYGTVNHCYIAWNSIENDVTDGVDKIVTYCNQQWAGCEARNIKVVPRVWLDYPGRPSGWPADMPNNPGWESDALLKRMEGLVAKLGKAWNNDPRIAWVQVGIFLNWGEQDYYGSPPPEPVLSRTTAAFNAAFPNKLIAARNYWTNGGSGYGVYWDSWGCPGQASRYGTSSGGSVTNRWKTPAVMEGEISYDYCPPVHSTPTDDIADTVGVARLCEISRWFHSTALGWTSSYTVGPATARGADMLQQALGYRLVIDTVRYSGGVAPGESLSVSFSVINTGSAQFLYKWPVEVSLLNGATKQPAWSAPFANLDIRQWLPGDKWDYDAINGQYKTHKYLAPPVKYRVSGKFALPSSLASGEYVLALAILDPAGMLPSARFAITNYWNGGRHPIGKVGVGVTVANPQLDESQFNDLKADNSLHYTLDSTPTREDNFPRRFASPAPFDVLQSARALAVVAPGARGVRVEIFDCNGKLISRAQGEERKLIIARPAAGMYLVHIASATGERLRKIVVR